VVWERVWASQPAPELALVPGQALVLALELVPGQAQVLAQEQELELELLLVEQASVWVQASQPVPESASVLVQVLVSA
jgi:hypothetical protein